MTTNHMDITLFNNATDKRWLEKYNLTCEFIKTHGFLPPWKTKGPLIQTAAGITKIFRMGNWINAQTECYDGRKGFPTMSAHRRKLFEFILKTSRHPSHPKHGCGKYNLPKDKCYCPYDKSCNKGKPFSNGGALRAHMKNFHANECESVEFYSDLKNTDSDMSLSKQITINYPENGFVFTRLSNVLRGAVSGDRLIFKQNHNNNSQQSITYTIDHIRKTLVVVKERIPVIQNYVSTWKKMEYIL